MSRDLRIAYSRPRSGGVADYAEQIEAIYRQLGYNPSTQIVDATTDPHTAVARIVKDGVDLCHFEIGAADSLQLAISRLLSQRLPNLPQLLTIHDPGIIIRHPLTVKAADSSNQLIRLGGKITRKLLTHSVGPQVLRRHLDQPTINTLYLRADCATGPRAYYLPQPTYHEHPVAPPKKPARVVGFGGYWGPGKGIETLLDAWGIIGKDSGLRLVLGGGTGDPNDPYATSIRERVMALHLSIEVPGFTAKERLDSFLQGLGVMVLPYWPELPNGASAMAMRAAELAVPIIASDVPSLRDLLGEGGTQYVPPKNPERLADAIRTFAANPKPFTARAIALQQQIYADHGWKTVGRRLESIITEVMGAHL
jgi:glycosyltransferase involved in cell wall biosynthesis